MTKYTKLLTENTQMEKPFDKPEMIQNDAGGYVFAIDDEERLMRFLILGSDSNTYYSTAKELTLESAEAIKNMIIADCKKCVDIIANISDSGRAPKNDPAIFALAMCASFGKTADERNYALAALNKVCRTATHLFQFVETISLMRGWGRSLKKYVSKWYTDKELKDIVYQTVKYRNRNNWSHKDVLRLSHPKSNNFAINSIFADITDKQDITKAIVESTNEDETFQLRRYSIAKNMTRNAYTENEICDYIVKYNLPMECLPTSMKNNKKVWETLLLSGNLPLTAMIRNLGQMSKCGVLNDYSDGEKKVIETLHNEEYIKKSRIHPLNILTAYYTYRLGHSLRGSNSWEVNSNIDSALEDAFYLAFTNVEPTNMTNMLALDVSGSMSCCPNHNVPITSSAISAAFAMFYLRTEKNTHVYGFSDKFIPLKINKNMSLDQVIRGVSHMTFGGTDCALPMLYALEKKIKIDNFIIFTDNETWFGRIHPYKALETYKKNINPNAKLIVCATDNNAYSIADKSSDKDKSNAQKSALNIVGFDSAWPQLIREFSLTSSHAESCAVLKP